MQRWLIRALIVLLVAGAIYALRATVFAAGPVPVRVVSLERGVVEATITNTKAGTVKARRRAGLSTGTAGIVVELAVERGDSVQAGQLLLRLNDATQASELAYAERSLEVAESSYARTCLAAARAQRELQRNEELARTQVVSADRIDSLHTALDLAHADCSVADAQVMVAAAGIEVARASLEKTVLRAPFDAIVADVAVELGEWVTPSVPLMAAPDLIDAIDPSSLYVSAPMDEVDAGLLSLGQPVRVLIDSHPGQSFPGRVVRLAPYVLDVENQNRTIEIEVELQDAVFSATLLPGTSADVEVILEVREDVLRVPTFALLEGGRVFTVEEGRLAEHTVEPGLRNWDWTEVVSGVPAHASVVTSLDRPGLEAGAEARIEPASARP